MEIDMYKLIGIFILIAILTGITSCAKTLHRKEDVIDICTSCFTPMNKSEYEKIEKRANSGDVNAAVELWKYHLRMNDSDESKIFWLEKAAEGGNEKAQFYFAIYLIETNDKTKMPQGLALLNKLSKSGDSEAKLKLADMYISGNYVTKDKDLGCRFLIEVKNSGYLKGFINTKLEDAECEF